MVYGYRQTNPATYTGQKRNFESGFMTKNTSCKKADHTKSGRLSLLVYRL